MIISGAAALVVLVAVAGVAMSSFAAETETGQNAEQFQGRGKFFGKNFDQSERGVKRGQFGSFHGMTQETRDAADAAIEAGDYNAWLEAVGEGCPMAQSVNADNFSKFSEAHKLMNQAHDIFAELGIERGGFGMGMHRNFR